MGCKQIFNISEKKWSLCKVLFLIVICFSFNNYMDDFKYV